jgi:hypothetical protein
LFIFYIELLQQEQDQESVDQVRKKKRLLRGISNSNVIGSSNIDTTKDTKDAIGSKSSGSGRKDAEIDTMRGDVNINDRENGKNGDHIQNSNSNHVDDVCAKLVHTIDSTRLRENKWFSSGGDLKAVRLKLRYVCVMCVCTTLSLSLTLVCYTHLRNTIHSYNLIDTNHLKCNLSIRE